MKTFLRTLVLLFSAAIVWQGIARADEAPAASPNPRDRFADPPTPLPRAGFDGGRFAIRPGEVIVLTGQTNAVLAQQDGSLETLLALGAAREQPRIRHMGWEGDTVYEQNRAMNFGGWQEQFAAVGASTIFAWFGQSEALDDEHSDKDFEAAYDQLLSEFAKATPRLVVVSPVPFEKPAGRWVPDNTPRNERLKRLANLAAGLAKKHGAIYIDLVGSLSAGPAHLSGKLTEDGLHLAPLGQEAMAKIIVKQLGLPAGKLADHADLRSEIVHKNRLWFDCWRTMNWAFPYGDRTWAQFSQPIGDHPSLADELAQYKPLVRAADERIWALALGKPAPQPAVPTVEPEPRHPPEEEQALFKLRDDLSINLWASEADGLVKPMQFCWDERGRMWALCTPSYPQLIPGVPASDYLLVCHDTDGDGRADRFERFAEGLVMPTGLALGDGGVYVCEATQLIHLADTDGDGRADRRRVIFSGFGTGDSHQLINSLTWGPDGRLWFTQGLHIISKVETPWGLAQCSMAGVWRMNPRTLRLESFLGKAAATENAWGVGFDDWGQAFYEPGNQNNSVYLEPALSPVPERFITKNQYQKIGALAVSKAKGMEIEFLSSSHLPDDLQGLLAKSVYMASSVELHQFIDEQSGFRSEPRGELVASASPMFRPLETRVGPDGAVYVCDWCNPIIGHYQASYRDPQRDHTHGRIWRLTAKDRPLVRPPALDKMSPAQLVDLLASPEAWIRQQAKQLLYRLPTEAVVAAADARLADLLAGKGAKIDAAGAKYLGAAAGGPTQTEHLLYELTGVLAAHEAVRPALIERLLTSPEPRLRAFGTHIVGLWADRLPEALALVRRMAADEFPRVRMEAAVAASYVPSPEAVAAATLVLDRPRDPWIDYALTESVLALKHVWYPALLKGELSFGDRLDHLTYILMADGSTDVAAPVRQLLEKPGLADDERAKLWALLARIGGPDDLTAVLAHAAGSVTILEALAESAGQGRRPGADADKQVATLRGLIGAPDAAQQAAAIRLAGLWNLKPLAGDIRARLDGPASSSAVTIAAIGALAQLDGQAALERFTSLVTSQRPMPERTAALRAVIGLDLPRAAGLIADEIDTIDNQPTMAAWLLPIVGRQNGARLLAEALRPAKLPVDVAKLAHRVLTSAGQADPELMTVLNGAIGFTAGSGEYNPRRVEELAAAVRSSGDAARGREVFQSKLANCTACHRVAGQGGYIGPDLSALGSATPLPLIIESILWPNRQVKEGFVAMRVITSDGQIITGYKVKEDDHELQLRDATTQQIRRLARDDVEAVSNAGSIMPEGLADVMTEAELRDLIRYLSELGRPSS